MGSKMILICLALFAIGNLVNTRSVLQKRVVPAKPLYGPGSTPNLKQIFLQRCSDYFDYIKYPSHDGLAKAAATDCPKIWNTFHQTFAYKDPCKPNSYSPFVEITSGPPIPANKALFWSGTMDIATKYADEGNRMVALANLLTGFLVKDNLIWCGTMATDGDGVDYKNCPTRNKCDSHGEFWKQASAMLAKRTVGVANALFHGSNTEGYEPYRSERQRGGSHNREGFSVTRLEGL